MTRPRRANSHGPARNRASHTSCWPAGHARDGDVFRLRLGQLVRLLRGRVGIFQVAHTLVEVLRASTGCRGVSRGVWTRRVSSKGFASIFLPSWLSLAIFLCVYTTHTHTHTSGWNCMPCGGSISATTEETPRSLPEGLDATRKARRAPSRKTFPFAPRLAAPSDIQLFPEVPLQICFDLSMIGQTAQLRMHILFFAPL